jgi:hypothetical protein
MQTQTAGDAIDARQRLQDARQDGAACGSTEQTKAHWGVVAVWGAAREMRCESGKGSTSC